MRLGSWSLQVTGRLLPICRFADGTVVQRSADGIRVAAIPIIPGSDPSMVAQRGSVRHLPIALVVTA